MFTSRQKCIYLLYYVVTEISSLSLYTVDLNAPFRPIYLSNLMKLVLGFQIPDCPDLISLYITISITY